MNNVNKEFRYYSRGRPVRMCTARRASKNYIKNQNSKTEKKKKTRRGVQKIRTNVKRRKKKNNAEIIRAACSRLPAGHFIVIIIIFVFFFSLKIHY